MIILCSYSAHQDWLEHVERIAAACGAVDEGAARFASALAQLSAELAPAGGGAARKQRIGTASSQISTIAPCLGAFAELLRTQAAGSIEASHAIGAALSETLRTAAGRERTLLNDGQRAFESAQTARCVVYPFFPSRCCDSTGFSS